MRILLILLLFVNSTQRPGTHIDLTAEMPRLAEWKIVKMRAGSYGGGTLGISPPETPGVFSVDAEVHSWSPDAVQYSVFLTNVGNAVVQVPVSIHSDQLPEDGPLTFHSLYIDISTPDGEAQFNLIQLFGSEYLQGSYVALHPKQTIRFIARSTPFRGALVRGMKLQVAVKGIEVTLTPVADGFEEFTLFHPAKRAVSPWVRLTE
jgi:hypothetical protein